MVDRYAGRGRHAEAEEIYAAEEVHTEARQAEGGASERARAHGGGLGGLSGTDYQMPAGDRAGQGVVGVKSSGEAPKSCSTPPTRLQSHARF